MEIRPPFPYRPTAAAAAMLFSAPPQAGFLAGDGFAGSVPQPETGPLGAAEAASPAVRMGALKSLVMVAGFGILGAIALATPVQAEEPARPSSTASVSSAELAEAKRYGLSTRTAQQLAAHPETADLLRDLPSDIASSYQRMTPAQKRVNYEELTGTTRVGLMKINNRKAFVEGSVMGVDALPRMHDAIDARVEKGDLTPKEGAELKANLTRLSRLTPRQRQAIADVVVWEGPGR